MRASLLHKTLAHDEGVWTISWVPNSSQLLSGSVDESVKLWDVATDGVKPLHTYTGHTLGVISVVAEASGPYAAASALDSVIRVWNTADNTTKSVLETPPSETWRIAFGPVTADAVVVAAAGGSTGHVTVYKAGEEDEGPQATFDLPQASDAGDKQKKERFALSVAYSPDYSRIACGAMDGTVAIFDVASGKLLHSLKGHFKPVRSLAFTPDGKMLLTGCDDMHANMYDVHQGSLVDAFSGHESWVLDVAVHPGGAMFATGSSDAKVKLWDLTTRTCSQTMTEHSDQVWAVSFSSDGTKLASASDDKQLVTYSVA